MKTKQSYTPQELADEYQVSVRKVYAWLLPIRKSLLEMTPGKQGLKLFIPKQVKLVREFLG